MNKFKQLLLLFNTILYLKPIQIRYQLFYRLRNKLFNTKRYSNIYKKGEIVTWENYIYNNQSWDGSTFSFLNISKKFETKINWNYSEHGKLWTYNLNYFDFLNQENIVLEEGLKLIDDYINGYSELKDGLEPYPTSLRIINTIKFIFRNEMSSSKIDDFIAEDVQRLLKNLEYHLLANHLLENIFALFFASYYFKDEELYQKAKRLLIEQLDEQILEDGAHFELSVMYHQLMLFRILDLIQLVRNSSWKTSDIQIILEETASKMSSWLSRMTFKNGEIPLFNDAAKNINPSSEKLFKYAGSLDIEIKQVDLSVSGYRKLENENYECFVDVGNVLSTYQPGHTHADTFGFITYNNGIPFLVEAGTGTYDLSNRRVYERSTSAHNTVVYNKSNSSEIWSSFRLGKRAEVDILDDKKDIISAVHFGYKPIVHKRTWHCEDRILLIEDELSNSKTGIAYFHLHPNVKVINSNENLICTSGGDLTFTNHLKLKVSEYEYSEQWNIFKKAHVLEVSFKNELTTVISFTKE